MLIGELVKRSGFTKDAIRFYEKKGLINLNKKQRRENNYKEYPEQVLERLMLIKAIKEFGFTLAEIELFSDSGVSKMQPAQKSCLLRWIKR